MRPAFTIALGMLLSAYSAWARQPEDLLARVDTLIQQKVAALDSIQQQTALRYNQLKQDYDSVSSAFSEITNGLQRQADSLVSSGLPAESLYAKLDSLNAKKEEVLGRIRTKADAVRSSTKEAISQLGLPPQFNSTIDEYYSITDKLDLALPKSDLKLPIIDPGNVPGLPLPEMRELPTTLGNLNVQDITGDFGEATLQIKALKQNIPDSISIEQIAAKIERQASDYIASQFGDLPAAPGLPVNEEAAKQQIMETVKEQVVNHFEGQQDKLKSAMELMSKYKQKYSSVQSLADLPRRPPNEMKGKPLRERLVPGITLQMQQRNDWWFDLNPYAGYRFTGKLIAGIGWNQRVAYNFGTGKFNSESRVFGIRSYLEYRLSKGLVPHIELECLNTPIRNLPDQSYISREWVWSAMAGMKKEYKLSKSIKGNAQILYNLFDPDHKSPYLDRLNMRMGVEYSIPMAKR